MSKAQDKLLYLRCNKKIKGLYDTKRKAELNKNTDIIVDKQDGKAEGKK